MAGDRSPKSILHVDMDAFYASVEQREDPSLKGKPVVVGSRPDERGVVSAASYEAREYGIHSAMPSREAGARCPLAVFLPPNMKLYQQVSRQIRGIFERFTPLVEPLSIDEAFLDVTGSVRRFGQPESIARKVKECISRETFLTASVGVAPNMFLAKLASDMDKPDGLTVVPRDERGIIAFLAPLPVSAIWGVGAVTRRVLGSAGIQRVRDLQDVSDERLAAILGSEEQARHLARLAHGRDEREVKTSHEEKSISREHTFKTDCSDVQELRNVLFGLVSDVASRLRARDRLARTAQLKLRWQGFETITRQRGIDPPGCDDFTLRETALSLFEAEKLVKPVRLIGFGLSNLVRPGASPQLELFDTRSESTRKKEALSRAVDRVRTKYGKGKI